MGKLMLILVGSLLLSLAFLAQGLYILIKGKFFPSRRFLRKPTLQRVQLALFYICCGVFALWVAGRVAHRAGVEIAPWGVLSGGTWIQLSMVAVGLLMLVRPDIGIRWVQAAHPEVPTDDKRMQAVVRIIGAIMLGASILFLAALFFS